MDDFDLLVSAGLERGLALRIADDLRQRDERYDGVHPLQVAIEDPSTGRLRLPADAQRYFAQRFAGQGLVLEEHLGDRDRLADGWNTVCRRERESLLEADLVRSADSTRTRFASAMAEKHWEEATHQLQIMKRRAALASVTDDDSSEP